MLDHDLSLTHSGSDSVPAFHEVCRSVLNPGSLSFVAANGRGRSSIRLRPPAATRKFLATARSTMLVRQLRKTERNSLRDLYCYSSSPAVKDETRDVAGRLHTWAAGTRRSRRFAARILVTCRLVYLRRSCGMLAMC